MKRGKRRNNPSSVVRTSRHALRGIQTTRSLTFAPKVTNKTTGVVTDSWLEQAMPYFVVAMKMIGALLATPALGASAYVSSMTQGILIGIDEIIYDHPITSPRNVTVNKKVMEVMQIDYSVGRLKHLKIVLSLMGAIQNRAGRLVAVLVPLIREKALLLREADSSSREDETKTFAQLCQMPGAIISPNLRPITISVKPSGFPASWVEVGQAAPRSAEDDTEIKYPIGGMPLYQLMVGYQDLATDSSDPSLAYSIQEAALCVELSGTVELDAPVSHDRYMRSKVIALQNSANITLLQSGTRKRLEVPLSSIRFRDGLLRFNGLNEVVEKLNNVNMQ